MCKIEKKEYNKAVETLKSLSNAKRLEILTHLANIGDCNVSTLQKAIDLPQPTLSQHLTRMYRSGVLARTKKGTEVFYYIANPAMLEGIKNICGLELVNDIN